MCMGRKNSFISTSLCFLAALIIKLARDRWTGEMTSLLLLHIQGSHDNLQPADTLSSWGLHAEEAGVWASKADAGHSQADEKELTCGKRILAGHPEITGHRGKSNKQTSLGFFLLSTLSLCYAKMIAPLNQVFCLNSIRPVREKAKDSLWVFCFLKIISLK